VPYDDFGWLRRQLRDFDKLTPDQLRNVEQNGRRLAQRQGLILKKSRRRDPHASDFSRYRIIDPATGNVVASELTLVRGVEWLLNDRLRPQSTWREGDPMPVPGRP
jgi:hypothetical protein